MTSPAKSLRPGAAVDIVLRVDFYREVMDVRRAMIYDVEGTTLVVSRPTPDVKPDHVGRRCTVTFVVRENEFKNRYGVPAKIVELKDNYTIRKGASVQAMILKVLGSVEPFNLRMAYRVRPPITSGIALEVNGERVSILDISTGGARFLSSVRPPLQYRQRVEIVLHLDDTSHAFHAFVVRTREPESRGSVRAAQEVAVQFSGMDKRVREYLAKRILQIDRELRAKGLEKT
ncbi:PilZ domain-containing protein [Desulfosoma caldarium]|uniref:PilZ domain-containing protein n=1 Tax=Desulfosoma caldarium TaxID=610254 RepID=A0A3N1ULC3_9BACT|nr:PilZ domain-containing protein [Desulfosoma caldarium]